MSTEYWLISAPGEKTCQQTWETVNNLTSKQNSLSVNYKFHIPDLKVGTLDQLVGLSDDLGKLDAFVETVTRKVATYLKEVLEDQRDKLHENLMANNSKFPSNLVCCYFLLTTILPAPFFIITITLSLRLVNHTLLIITPPPLS